MVQSDKYLTNQFIHLNIPVAHFGGLSSVVAKKLLRISGVIAHHLQLSQLVGSHSPSLSVVRAGYDTMQGLNNSVTIEWHWHCSFWPCLVAWEANLSNPIPDCVCFNERKARGIQEMSPICQKLCPFQLTLCFVSDCIALVMGAPRTIQRSRTIFFCRNIIPNLVNFSIHWIC